MSNLQKVKKILRTYVDKYAYIKGNTVQYSIYFPKSGESVLKHISASEADRIVKELEG